MRKQAANSAALIFLFVLCISGSAWAEAMQPAAGMEPVKKVVTMEKVNGEVTGISTGAIAILYEQKGDSEFEIQLPIAQDVALDHYKGKSDIKKGDIVDLHYEKVVEAPGEPRERISMTAKKIRFVKRPNKDALVSKE